MEKKKFDIVKALKWFFDSFIWLGLILLFIDILTKNLIIKFQDNIFNGGGRNGGVDIIPGFLGVNYIINSNVVFGWDIFKNPLVNRIVFIVVALLAAIGIIIYLIFKWDKTNRFYKACLFMIISGAIGNAIDRIFYTSEYLHQGVGGLATGVVDWIDFYGIWGFNFNIADSCVVVGTIILIVYLIVDEVKELKKKRDKEVKESNGKVLSKEERSRLEQKEETPAAEETKQEEEKPEIEEK